MVIMTEYASSKNVHLHNVHLIVILFFVLCYANCSCLNKDHQDYFLLLLKISSAKLIEFRFCWCCYISFQFTNINITYQFV